MAFIIMPDQSVQSYEMAWGGIKVGPDEVYLPESAIEDWRLFAVVDGNPRLVEAGDPGARHWLYHVAGNTWRDMRTGKTVVAPPARHQELLALAQGGQ